MKKFVLPVLGILFVIILNVSGVDAGELQLRPNDRILVLAPHPDDETIGAGGILQQAIAMKLPVKVVYLTNGDNNELAFLIYRKHPVLRQGLIKMGYIRRQEAITAMASLGVEKKQLIFLGYPDFGTLHIFTEFWGNTKPYKSFLTRTNTVPYQESPSFSAPYVGESVLKDLEKILVDFKPTRIFTTHPADTNADHRAAFLFLTVALWDLKDKIVQPTVHPFIVHMSKWPTPRGFHPELNLELPPRFANVPLWDFKLSDQQVQNKKEAINLYKSQNAYNPWYLYTFARKNELFIESPEVVLQNTQEESIDWEKLDRTQNIESHLIDEEKVDKKYLRTVSFAHNGKYLFVNIQSRLIANELLAFHIYLLGYKEQTPFAQMPKIRAKTQWGRRMIFFNKRQPIFQLAGAKIKQKGNTMNIQIPLSALENPQEVFTCVQVGIAGVPVEATAWRILHLQ